MEEINGSLNLVLLGKVGVGKSSSGNTILGRQAFESTKSLTSVTRSLAVESETVFGFQVTVYDTPGSSNPVLNQEEIQQIYEDVLHKCKSVPSVFLLVIKVGRFTENDRKTVEKIEEMLVEKHLEKTWILFTRGDELEEENMTIQEFIDDAEALKKLVQKYDQRYHVFNNKKRDKAQVGELLTKINFSVTMETEATNPKTTVSSPSSMRIVLLGKTGVGKSAAGNTILGQREFRSVMSMNTVTRESTVRHATVSERSVSVVDTPGFFDTEMNPEDSAEEIARSIYISSPGPHAFLIVFPVNMRFTEQEEQIPQMIEKMFGQEVLKYSIILFTHGDLLYGESVEEIIEEYRSLRRLVNQYGGRYQVFNNRDENNRQQVNDLLQMIDTMIEQNGGGHYSNQIYEDAQRFRREQEERRLREEEERRRRVEERRRRVEERRRREEEERRRREEEERRRREEEERRRREEEERRRREQSCVCS